MFPELGFILFISCLLLNTVMIFSKQVLNNQKLEQYWQKKITTTVFILLSTSMLILFWCFYTDDLSVQIVARFSNEKMPLIYKLCALWGGHEGAMLLWLWILATYKFILARVDHKLIAVKAQALSILSIIYTSFASFMLFTSNPFARFLPNTPITGKGLNPLLQDIGMALHPPMLYLGYVGLAVVFALTISALYNKQLKQDFANLVKPFALIAWASLTIGIVLGSWWAYHELGWGGWWFWDPVENASLMPWLVAMALVHMIIVLQKTNKWLIWTVLLAVLGFVLSLLGTFLVRSGILVSVHSFAQDPNKGLILLIYLAITMIATLWIIMQKSKDLDDDKEFNYSKTSCMLLGSGLSIASMLTILIGTIYPIISQVVFNQTIAVGAKYFNQVVAPLFLLAALLAGFAMQINSNKAINKNLIIRLLLSISITIIWLSYLYLLEYYITSWLIIINLAGVWLAVSTIYNCKINLKTFPMVIGHIGFAIIIIATGFNSQLSSKHQWQMRPKQTIKFNNYQLTLNKINDIVKPNYKARQADFRLVIDQNKAPIKLKPEQQLFTASGIALAKIDSYTNWWQDFYLALGQKTQKNTWAVRIMINVAVYWIWFGGVLIALGSIISLITKKAKKNQVVIHE